MKLTLCLSLAAGLCHGVNASWLRLLHDFTTPPVEYRPKFRYWLPDASVDPDVVRDDLRQMAAVGAGGFELLPYFELGDDPSHWGEFGYGTEAYRRIFRVAMETAKEEGLLMDFAVAANQGQGVPAAPGTEGLAMHLTYSNVTVAPGQTFSGSLPLSRQPPNERKFMHPLEEFGEQSLTAVLAIEVLPDDNTTARQYKKIDRIINLTDQVAAVSRSLTWTAPETVPGATWQIMAWYERHTNQRSIDGGPEAQTYVQNGSWIVDHFSAAGARRMTDFFDTHVVPEQSDRDLLAAVGKYAWEDSMEMHSTVWWTRGFDSDFLHALGYDIRPCLPLLLVRENSWAQLSTPYGVGFESVNASRGDACNHDYRSVLQAKYEEYVQAHVRWARLRGLEYSNQPAYNLPLSMVDSSRLLDAPEGENLGFIESIDAYRHMSGPSHFRSNPVTSSELGAVRGTVAYSQTLSRLLYSFHRGLAGGISMNVLHGFPYGGPFRNTTWPGVTIFHFLFPEMWGPRQPTWRVFPDLLAYMARSQYILQAGTARVDLAIYADDAPWTLSSGYQSANLQEAGFTYDYIGPALLGSNLAITRESILVPDGPAYKALIISNTTTIESATVTKLLKLAHDGLHIFLIGDFGVDRDAMGPLFQRDFPRVSRLASSNALPKALKDAGIIPNAAPSSSDSAAGWYSFWRSTDEAEIAWFYNDGVNDDTPSRTVDISFSGMANKMPVLLDAWSGQGTPLHYFKRGETDMVIPLTLAANETKIIAFIKNRGNRGPKSHITEFSGAIAAFFSPPVDESQDATFALLSSGAASVTLSNGTEVHFEASVPEPTVLDLWNITIESWQRPDGNESSGPNLQNLRFSDTALLPWINLDGDEMDQVSGVGYYSTEFALPLSSPQGRRLSAHLHLGRFEGAVRLWLNGRQLPSAVVYTGNDTVIDLTRHLHGGSRDVAPSSYLLEVEVSTTLLNRVRADRDSIISSGIGAGDITGAGPRYEATSPARYGLHGPVWVEWLEMVQHI
ncbi:hypothetical protein BJX68DRAFT_273689 [Aspergillus pseudodeflectus]|uniref:Secreted protein n=1 Tax=Aspergillus pseudodeflectus TaxID=176178 RepID=A0ABR4J774_9EURO